MKICIYLIYILCVKINKITSTYTFEPKQNFLRYSLYLYLFSEINNKCKNDKIRRF